MLTFRALLTITPKRLEAVGVGLVFIAAFWEATVIRETTELYTQAPFVALAEKLKLIWMALGEDAPRPFVFNQTQNFDALNWARTYRDLKAADPTLALFSLLRWAVFGIGTLMVIAGKWWDGTPR
jgi:hypothetical protein